ncbi:MAG: HXXEE domain-containing protein [Pseudorhodoplanes sp.]|nr:HXXEE domain-containing protein [Pseudorhodoplanes sp.]
MQWFERNWMLAGATSAVLLLALAPLMGASWPVAMLAVYLQLPFYMLHQVEEHYGDRFRKFFNEFIAGGLPALTTPVAVLINVPGVWGVDLISIYLARFVDIGLGLIAVYLMLVNAITHIIAAIILRRYNPGLVSAIVLFIPASVWAIVAISAVPGVDATDHAIGLGIAVAMHVAIVVYMKIRVHILTRTPLAAA